MSDPFDLNTAEYNKSGARNNPLPMSMTDVVGGRVGGGAKNHYTVSRSKQQKCTPI